MILEGGAWELDICKILKEDAETVNIIKQKCSTYPNCFMCDCSDNSWTKISIEDLIGKEEYLRNNINIAYSFLLEDINDEDYNSQSFCSYNYIVQKSHREYIWINIS
jgi:hypothetical protein